MAAKKYHVNHQGQAGLCKATKRPCRFGGESGEENHFQDFASARAAAEAKVAQEEGGTVGGGVSRRAAKATSSDPMSVVTPAATRLWAVLVDAGFREAKLEEAYQGEKRKQVTLWGASARLDKADAIEASRDIYPNDYQWQAAVSSPATRALRDLTSIADPSDHLPTFPHTQYPDLASLREAVDAQLAISEAREKLYAGDLHLHQVFREEAESSLVRETGYRENPRFGVPTGERVLEKITPRNVGNYSSRPTKDVAVLKDSQRFCTKCDGALDAITTGWSTRYAHRATGESTCVTSTGGASFASPNAVCGYCGTGDPAHHSFRQQSYSDEASCSRCGGVQGRAIGD